MRVYINLYVYIHIEANYETVTNDGYSCTRTQTISQLHILHVTYSYYI